MKNFLSHHLIVSAYALTCAIIIILCAWYVNHTQLRITAALKEKITEHSLIITDLTKLTDSNGIDTYAGAVLHDCPRREEFETLLGNLNRSSKQDLIHTQQLFESCGNFFAERKALVVAHLEQEYAMLTELAALLSILEDLDSDVRRSLRADEIIVLEKDRSIHLSELVILQEKIITALLADNGATEVSTLAGEAREVNETLAVLDAQVDQLRAEIFP